MVYISISGFEQIGGYKSAVVTAFNQSACKTEVFTVTEEDPNPFSADRLWNAFSEIIPAEILPAVGMVLSGFSMWPQGSRLRVNIVS